MRDIDVIAAKAALADQHGDLRGRQRGVLRSRIHHHAREPRRQRQAAQLASLFGDAAVAVDGAEFAEQGFGLGECRARRRIEEGELLGRAAPGRKIERERRQIGGQDFRSRKCFERSRLRLIPEPVADARLGAAGTAAPLIGRGARHPHGFEPRHADVGLVARHPREPASRRQCARPRW